MLEQLSGDFDERDETFTENIENIEMDIFF